MRTPLSKVSVLPGLTVTKRIHSSLAPQALPAQHSWSHKQPSQRSKNKRISVLSAPLRTHIYRYTATNAPLLSSVYGILSIRTFSFHPWNQQKASLSAVWLQQPCSWALRISTWVRQSIKFAGRQRQHHQENVLPHPILHKSEFDFSSKVVKSERRRVRLLRIINNASVGCELRAHYSSVLEE